MYQYNVTVTKVVDGDTIDVDIDLGFSVVLKKQRVRLMGIDTPESRTRDLVEKKFGKASKKHLKDLLSQGQVTLISHDKGKFGRILGEIWVHSVENEGHPVFENDTKFCVNAQMINDNHAVPYDGQSKEDIVNNHLVNREILIERGVVEL